MSKYKVSPSSFRLFLPPFCSLPVSWRSLSPGCSMREKTPVLVQHDLDGDDYRDVSPGVRGLACD